MEDGEEGQGVDVLGMRSNKAVTDRPRCQAMTIESTYSPQHRCEKDARCRRRGYDLCVAHAKKVDEGKSTLMSGGKVL
jgi:hypothetical protein